ncbi:TetR family transcriptional regulator C-terminal domain-containing protein [Flavobacterium sp. NRK F7]|uniref:TetR family transcriptional regulator C-terminal domain-containing protein n=1 Tax=Flavobacterium sp. NRK F7 TaxID=2954930 RepID=UPI002090A12C|nr:TetR family transcriptional regulator C-terminal domain-containing protein [Flavobacterium sp. NRK F7]MCO6163054.1 TetR family transcriptional regulator C-terminal domain-containing protein [Flavobacterium sp. NRK F7]
MAKKLNLTKERILSEYSKFVLTEGKKPNSIYQFCQHLKVDESEFYRFFTNFEQLESTVFTTFFESTVALLENSEEYVNYNAKTRLLSFYFTFFEQMTANRSFVLHLLQEDKNQLKNLRKLNTLRIQFKGFVDRLEIETLKIPQETIEKIQQKSISELAWIQFLMTLKFWIDDTSPSFEKTDVFIEKSIHASFDLIDMTPLKNIIDFGKFLWKEKVSM